MHAIYTRRMTAPQFVNINLLWYCRLLKIHRSRFDTKVSARWPTSRRRHNDNYRFQMVVVVVVVVDGRSTPSAVSKNTLLLFELTNGRKVRYITQVFK